MGGVWAAGLASEIHMELQLSSQNVLFNVGVLQGAALSRNCLSQYLPDVPPCYILRGHAMKTVEHLMIQ